jgi:ribosomal protein S4
MGLTWNSRTFRLYENDLWGTLVLSYKPSRVLNHLVLLYKSTKRFKRKLFFKKLKKIKSQKPVFDLGLLVDQSVYVRRFSRLRHKSKKFRRRESGLKYIVDYTETKPFDRLFARSRRRSFLSQLMLGFRKFKKFYSNMTARQFSVVLRQVRTVSAAGDNLRNLVSRLESRSDMVLYRSGLATSPFMARQLLSHKHVCLNFTNRLKFAFQSVSKGDLVLISPRLVDYFSKLKLIYLKRFYVGRKVRVVQFYSPDYLETDYRTFSSSLIADILFKRLFFPFKVDSRQIEWFVHKA